MSGKPGRKDVWKTEQGIEIEAKLLRGEIKQKDAAGLLGITPAAVCAHLKRIRKPLLEKKEEVLKETAEKAVSKLADEVNIIIQNIDRLESLQKELESQLYVSPAWVSLYLKTLKELREHAETLLKLKGEMPEMTITFNITKYEQHITILNNFIFEKHPELIDEYEQYLREKLNELRGPESY